MKIKLEISPDFQEEEIVIRCKENSDKIKKIESALENLINEKTEIVLYVGETEYFVPFKKILFFEMQGGKVIAHTKDKAFEARSTLAALEESLPQFFLRGSKSCIINVSQVSAITRNLTGPSKVYFSNTDKIIYVSRAYYKFLKDKIHYLRGL